MEKEELEQALALACRRYGVYEVAKILTTVAQKSSDEMAAAGNSAAVVHRDYAAMKDAVFNMKLAHPLRLL